MIDLFPPFDPGRPGSRRRMPNIRRLPMRMILPNLVTLLALCSGLTAVRMAMESRYDLAILAVVLAAVLDGLDGRVARLLKSTSRFGAELDSLTDFVNFGVAPAVLLYSWVLHDLRSVGWIVVLVFSIGAALRLARFNVALDDVERPAWQGNFFTGVPSPAGAICVLLPINLGLLGVIEPTRETAIVSAVFAVVMGFLMVSRLPTYSGKKLGKRVRRDLVLPLFVLVVLVAGFLVSYPFEMLALASIAYLACLPLGLIAWRRAAAQHARQSPAAAPPPAGGESA
ncbi:CDP-diacylglycerol--serine O-phosphatidyltransferase [Pseudoxanthobacter sp.]|uniref:CDP-diacylglycerol--serine O-phosphatidyltransferase n=1 Tax=Pseudoxanthobacter sp. TaxID=1925742 RepID=UPI002FE3ADEC